MAKSISTIQKQELSQEQQKQQMTDELLNVLLENADGIEETVKLWQALHESGILPALGALVKAKEQMASIAAHQMLRPPVTNAINNAMAAGSALSSIDSEMTKRLISSLTDGLKKAEEGIANKQTTSVWELMHVMKDPDLNRALTFGLNVLRGIGQGLSDRE